MNMDHIVYLALGTNIGNRAANLKRAVYLLPPQMTVKAKSKVYETQPWGYTEQDPFLNQVVMATTYLKPTKLIKHIKRLEAAMGRKANFRHGPRLIDIDILFYDDVILETPTLTLPHPSLHERGFVLLPLMDIAPGLIHPVKGKSIRELIGTSNMEGIVEYKK
jgi:2-amino-4-hydroxy-6-hydroxymethyldihydropteridine diphosphokinase